MKAPVYTATPPQFGGWYHYQDTAVVAHRNWFLVGRLVEGGRLIAVSLQGTAFWVDDLPGKWAGPFSDQYEFSVS